SWSALSQPYYWPLLYLHIIAVLEEELRIVNSDQLLKWQLLLLDVSSCNPDTISSENNGDVKAKDTNFWIITLTWIISVFFNTKGKVALFVKCAGINFILNDLDRSFKELFCSISPERNPAAHGCTLPDTKCRKSLLC